MRYRPISLISALVLSAGTAGAATYTETSFSGNPWNPTVIDGTAFEAIEGSWRWSTDIIAISGLSAGQTLNFTFRPDGHMHYGYAAGGVLMASESPFKWIWGGTRFGKVDLSFRDQSPQSFSVTLSDHFNEGGDQLAYFGLYNTHGRASYVIDGLPGARGPVEPPAAIPVPAGVWLLGTALGGLLLHRRLRRG